MLGVIVNLLAWLRKKPSEHVTGRNISPAVGRIFNLIIRPLAVKSKGTFGVESLKSIPSVTKVVAPGRRRATLENS